jgi:uncharacterized protein
LACTAPAKVPQLPNLITFLVNARIMNFGAVLPSVTTKCPKCRSTQLRRSSWHRSDGNLKSFFYSPYRCVECEKRFFKLSHRFESLLGKSLLFMLVAAAIVGIVYVMNMDGMAPPPPPRTVVPAVLPVKGGDPARSLAPYARAAAGDAQSQYEMGILYLNGEGGAAKNYAEALKWLELAANGGHMDARYNLGVMYKTGLGALQNFELAFQWFELAAGQNHAEAQYNVALMHKMGMSVPVDFVKAYTWANIGAVQGHIGAITLRDNLLQAMTPQQVLDGQRASRDWKPSDEKPKRVLSPASSVSKG